MDAYIRRAVERVTGESAANFDWSESLTTATELEALLPSAVGRGTADLLFVTDHVNETTKEFDDELVELACRDPRVGLGAELQTVVEVPVGSGRWRDAPEVLLYGRSEPVGSKKGSHFGVDAQIVAEIQQRCRPAGAPRAELFRTLNWCREERVAHALAHPLDGHFLDLPTTLAALAACRFVEVVNGGFSGPSTRRLERYVGAHNRSRGTLALPGRGEHREPLLVPWAGSDAHFGDYGRVLVEWAPRRDWPVNGVGSFLGEMLETPAATLLAEEVFAIEGRGQSLAGCLREVMALIFSNARRNRSTFRGARRLARLAVIGPWLGLRKVLLHRQHQRRLGRALDAWLSEEARGASPEGEG